MRSVPARRPSTFALPAATIAAALGVWAGAAGGAARAPGCPSFSSQADAQERFFLLDGTPSRNAGGLDGDGDGVACEGLQGPYAGFATIGYHRGRGFFYGTASMPSTDTGGGFACLAGNRHYPDGPRLLKIYRAVPGPDKAISSDIGAEAKPSSGRLVWKLDRGSLVPGRYYVVFEEQIRLSPYRPSVCPEFRSHEAHLPRMSRVTSPLRSG